MTLYVCASGGFARAEALSYLIIKWLKASARAHPIMGHLVQREQPHYLAKLSTF